jgi:hypothetical protein
MINCRQTKEQLERTENKRYYQITRMLKADGNILEKRREL